MRINRVNKNRNKEEEQFEFCKVCKLNHSNGRRHIYFPNHAKALSSLLTRFTGKLNEIRFFLKHPSLLPPEHTAKNGLWCVFCDVDISEIGSSFACENAIKHLASDDHLANVRGFMWRHGGKKEQVDSCRLLESDISKWHKSCTALKNSLSSEGHSTGLDAGPDAEPFKNIQPERNSVNKDISYNRINCSFESSVSNGVFPLQYFTNERCQVSHPEVTGNGVGSLPLFNGSRDVSVACSPSGSQSMNQVWRWNSGEGTTRDLVLHRVTPIPQVPSEGPMANVHTGAAPPWLNTDDEIEMNIGASQVYHVNKLVVHSEQSKKTQKLNPKRVGAAWAEKRKAELEREKRGETVASYCSEDWLPNFGRVWQSGSRKESRKEFEMEKLKQKTLKEEDLIGSSITVRPYVSKRMRTEEPIRVHGGDLT